VPIFDHQRAIAPAGPLFDSEAEAYEFYCANRAELKAKGMKSSGN
jgi:hypothetical protein